jgi:hypothetical protein
MYHKKMKELKGLLNFITLPLRKSKPTQKHDIYYNNINALVVSFRMKDSNNVKNMRIFFKKLTTKFNIVKKLLFRRKALIYHFDLSIIVRSNGFSGSGLSMPNLSARTSLLT